VEHRHSGVAVIGHVQLPATGCHEAESARVLPWPFALAPVRDDMLAIGIEDADLLRLRVQDCNLPGISNSKTLDLPERAGPCLVGGSDPEILLQDPSRRVVSRRRDCYRDDAGRQRVDLCGPARRRPTVTATDSQE